MPPQPRVGDPCVRRIGQVAAETGLSLRTLRYYEQVGLVEPAGRTEGGFRLYDDDAVSRLRLVMLMKPLGLTLEQVREVLAALDGEGTDPDQVLSRYQALASDRVRRLRRDLAAAEHFAADLAGRGAARATTVPTTPQPEETR